MTEEAPKRHEQVNEFTKEEQERIRNETSKPAEPYEYCLSPDQYRRAINRALSLAASLSLCKHVKPVYVGAITYCSTCGAIRRPLPTPKLGVPIADGEWERPVWVEQLRELRW